VILLVFAEGEAAMAARRKNTDNDTGNALGPAAGQPGGDGAEVAEERVEVVAYAAAVDIAKGSGMVCTQVPGSRPDRKRQRVAGRGHLPRGGRADGSPVV
jgi:hypothetical protein